MTRLLEGKTGLIMGIANKRSIAWGVANSVNSAGARLILTHQNERLGENVRELAPLLNNPMVLPCDVASDEQIQALMDRIREEAGHLDFLVHALAYAPREALSGMYAETKRADFAVALDVSAYSLAAISRAALPLMQDRQASIVTLTYFGSERVIQNYNVMGVAKAALEASVRYLANDLGPQGIRVNAISAGPIKTLASSAVSGISNMIKLHAERAPLRKQVDIEEVGDTALFLVSPLSRGISGEVIYVDGGYHILGV
ncbi:MAG: enoyl-ACP reductase [Acidobacteria bacterium 13_1_20CM_2_55_15]|nr:MAG: enoyl-ACP reductase [Acidobacteria bacterium 13_1_40CM_56_16]OLD20767.1 MAG: enoyl-ACP reductase [Acidobacteria bacterium 13_1_40CM_3_56_11]OLD70966.1 MAG: enoyl-ACP reductase [Acidobacteria bacterium 13_1_40CM_2_56_11]OLE90261.1 MAG: enoyl-ACP reductase [Acidobacteria bacterium 13_1_20CM_2_55_15]PYR70783.1 MAG: NADH-specific enoyl-ACP reductase [Acidobacteriota bacterium]